MIKLKIDTRKISHADLYEGKKGTYLDAVLMDNRDGRDNYGNDGFIVQSISKEKRNKGERGPIIGNWSDTQRDEGGNRRPQEKPRQQAPAQREYHDAPEGQDDVPF
jgi:hypothetical protein